MANDSMVLIELLERTGDSDLLRNRLGFMADRLRCLATEHRCEAGFGEQ